MSYKVADTLSVLKDISRRKEFRTTSSKADLLIPGLKLSGAQLFLRGFGSPNTPYKRFLVKWQTGAGKSIVSVAIGHEYVKLFREMATLGEKPPSIFVLSFISRETIQEELLRHPEFGFVSRLEVDELKRMRTAVTTAGPNSAEAKKLSIYLGSLRRRTTDRNKGGYYQFYGYKEFANSLFRSLDEKFDIQDLVTRGVNFEEKLAEAVASGLVSVNTGLINEIRNGVLICDEIQNNYNILESNNYGLAIQYVLDTLGNEAPTSIFMSGTPITGSASEIIDLANLVVPKDERGGKVLQRSDFFSKTTSSAEEEATNFVVSQLKEGALDKISRLFAGRVSYLLDSDTSMYPKRIFVGQDIPDIPYLKITPCVMSPFHERTLNLEQPKSSGLSPSSYTLYDIAFPNPEYDCTRRGLTSGNTGVSMNSTSNTSAGTFTNSTSNTSIAASLPIGLYKSAETPMTLMDASDDWKLKNGVIVEKTPSSYIITGPFLHDIDLFSTKSSEMLKIVLDVIKSGQPGKIMIYHHRVRMSGVLLQQEILRMNGFADEFSLPTDETICSICGVKRMNHGDAAVNNTVKDAYPPANITYPPSFVPPSPHEFMPARFVVAHSDVDRASMLRSISKYNSDRYGYNFRVLIGSKVIKEGLDFKGIRFQIIMSLPTDIPTLMQIFGRVVRRNSHIDLEEMYRDAKIWILISTRANGAMSPELQRYVDKMKEYLVIQTVEKALHENAVDGFINFEKIQQTLSPIDTLPYEPVVKYPENPVILSTYFCYEYANREVMYITYLCRALFRVRPVWTKEDLWDAITSGKIGGINYDITLFDYDNFLLAFDSLKKPVGNPPMSIIQAGKFFISSVSSLDIESYLRLPNETNTVIKVSDYIAKTKNDYNFELQLHAFRDRYLLKTSKFPLELCLVEYGAAFHFAVIKRIITNEAINIDLTRLVTLYRRFKIVLTASELKRTKVSIPAGSHIAGYIDTDVVHIYHSEKKAWLLLSRSELGIGKRFEENNIVVGFTSSGVEVKFKIRPPYKAGVQVSDLRQLIRGAVCETRPREELDKIVKKLRESLTKIGGGEDGVEGVNGVDNNTWGHTSEWDVRGFLGDTENIFDNVGEDEEVSFAVRYDFAAKRRFPSTNELALTIKQYLLALEENARSDMMNGVRWLYLFNDPLP